MTVFKLYFKLFFKNIVTIILYSAIFIAIILLIMSSIKEQTPNFEEVKSKVVFIDNDNTTLTQGLKEYLEPYAEFKDIDEELLNEAFFYRDAQYIIKIPKGFTESFATDKEKEILKRSIPDEVSSYFIDNKVANYLSVAYAYVNNNLASKTEVAEIINHDLTSKTKVIIPFKEIQDYTEMSLYFNYLGYVLIALIITVSATVIASFSNFDLKRRNTLGSISNKKFNILLIIAIFTSGLLLLALYYVIAIILYGDKFFTAQGLYMQLNTFVFMIAIVALAYLLTLLFKNKMLISGVGTVLSLGFAFLSGGFLPQELLSRSVLNISMIFPYYYQVTNNDLLVNSNFLKGDYWLNITIMLVFAVMFSLISLIVSKKKIQAES